MARCSRMAAAAALLLALGVGTAGAEQVKFTMKNYPRNYLGTIHIVSLDEPRKRWHAEIEREDQRDYNQGPLILFTPFRPRELFGNNPDAIAAFDLPPGWYTVNVVGYESKTFFVDLHSTPDVILRRIRPAGLGEGGGDDGGGDDD